MEMVSIHLRGKMMLGLKRGTVNLQRYNNEWKTAAEDTILLLKQLFGEVAIDMQHVGSTAIENIHAKPIIDIVVGVKDIEEVFNLISVLEEKNIFYRPQDVKNQLLFVIGDFVQDTRTHHIHIVIWSGQDWNNYINFRDYLNTFPLKAEAYDKLKLQLAEKYCDDRIAYTNEKKRFLDILLNEAREWRHNVGTL